MGYKWGYKSPNIGYNHTTYNYTGLYKGSIRALGSLRGALYKGLGFKGPCTQIVYTLALKYSLYRYIGTKVYTIWVHGPLGV